MVVVNRLPSSVRDSTGESGVVRVLGFDDAKAVGLAATLGEAFQLSVVNPMEIDYLSIGLTFQVAVFERGTMSGETSEKANEEQSRKDRSSQPVVSARIVHRSPNVELRGLPRLYAAGPSRTKG